MRAVVLLGLGFALAGLACNAAGIDGRAPQVTATLYSPAQPPAEMGAVPSAEAEAQGSSGAGDAGSGDFLESDCSCAGYEATTVRPWGSSSLSCRYEWSGANIDNNALGFEIVDYINHEDELGPAFKQEVEHLSFSAGNQGDDWQVEQPRNDDGGYAFFGYGPGGGGKQGDIPMCGNGRGVFQVDGRFYVTTELFACDLPYSVTAYANALADMETCARRAIARANP
jgi:hypothetical protein